MKINVAVGRLIRAALCSVVLAFASASQALAQAPTAAPDTGPDVFGNMPGAVFLLIPLLIGGAIYVSRKLGPEDEDTTPKREGAVSRALARQRKDSSS